MEVQNKKYDRLYYLGKESNYIFGYQNLRFEIFWRRRLRILKKISSSGKLLDIGCAFGFFLKILQKRYQVYGIDISEYAIQQAKRLVSKPERLKQYDINQGIPFEEKFNVIVAFDIIEHIEDPLNVFRVISRFLEENGYLYLEMPCLKTLINRDSGHIYRSKEEWFALLSCAGFKVWFAQGYYTVGLRSIMIPTERFSNYCSIIAKLMK